MSDSFQDLSEDQLAVVLVMSNKIMIPLFQCLGLLANFLNVIIFKQLGLKDSMNISFWALSLSDFCYVLCSSVINVCLIIALSPWQQVIPVSMLSLSGWLAHYQYIFLDTSTCSQTYMALARCCCVTIPFRFKNVFTCWRTVFVIAMAFLVNILFRIPLVSSHGLSWQTNPLTNITRFTIWFSNDFPFFMSLEKIVGRTIFPVIFLVVTFICSVILAQSLAAASRKRKLMTSISSGEIDMNKHFAGKEINNLKTASSCPQDDKDVGHLKSKVLSSRELQVVKAVALVTAFKAVALLFICVFALAEASIPEFFPGRKYKRLHATVTAVMSIVLCAHKSGNILIYYMFNTRFRESLHRNFCPRCIVSTLRQAY